MPPTEQVRMGRRAVALAVTAFCALIPAGCGGATATPDPSEKPTNATPFQQAYHATARARTASATLTVTMALPGKDSRITGTGQIPFQPLAERFAATDTYPLDPPDAVVHAQLRATRSQHRSALEHVTQWLTSFGVSTTPRLDIRTDSAGRLVRVRTAETVHRPGGKRLFALTITVDLAHYGQPVSITRPSPS